MTLKQAIAEIGMKANECLDAWQSAGSLHRADPYYEGKADALDEALQILEEVEEGLDREGLAARVKQWQAESLVRMMSPSANHDSRAWHDGRAAAFGEVLEFISAI